MFVGGGTVGLYAYVNSADLEPWGSFQPWIESAPTLFAAVGAAGILIYAFVRRFS